LSKNQLIGIIAWGGGKVSLIICVLLGISEWVQLRDAVWWAARQQDVVLQLSGVGRADGGRLGKHAGNLVAGVDVGD